MTKFNENLFNEAIGDFEGHGTPSKSIKLILDKFHIKNYTIRPDGTVDVDGDVDLRISDLIRIPVQFGTVNGDFRCSYNPITSLAGCPKIVKGNFECINAQLLSLEGGPRIVGRDFWCVGNRLKSLAGCPKIVKGKFMCYDNQKRFTENEVRSVCKVGGEIKVLDKPNF